MRLSSAQLERAAAETGFRADPLEKVLHLLELLEALRSHPFLQNRLVLKGGTALNLFVLDLPRLSVDIDLNYVGAVHREGMLSERPKVEQAVQAVCARQGLMVRRSPSEHAGGKWRLGYGRAAGGMGALELDLNFLQRMPLWDVAVRDSLVLGSGSARGIAVLDEHELAAGKLAALFGRDASRDLFDVHGLLSRRTLDPQKLRLAFVIYGACSRRDWRDLSIEDVRMDAHDAEHQLVPLLRSDLAPERPALETWIRRLVAECQALVSDLLAMDEHEIEFLDRVSERGEIVPDLLTEDTVLQQRIRSHPALIWKALNVRRHRGVEERPGPGQWTRARLGSDEGDSIESARKRERA